MTIITGWSVFFKPFSLDVGFWPFCKGVVRVIASACPEGYVHYNCRGNNCHGRGGWRRDALLVTSPRGRGLGIRDVTVGVSLACICDVIVGVEGGQTHAAELGASPRSRSRFCSFVEILAVAGPASAAGRPRRRNWYRRRCGIITAVLLLLYHC